MPATQKFSTGRAYSELARLELPNLAASNEYRAKGPLSRDYIHGQPSQQTCQSATMTYNQKTAESALSNRIV